MFSDDYIIYPGMRDAISYYKRLKQESFVKLESRDVVRCVSENDLDFADLSTDEKRCTAWIFTDSFVNGLAICDNCKREVSLDRKTNRKVAYVVAFQYDNVFDFIKETLSSYSTKVIPTSRASWRVYQNKESVLFSTLDALPLHLVHNYLQSLSKGVVLISLSNRLHLAFKKQYPLWPCISLQEIMEDTHVVEDAIIANSQKEIDELEISQCRNRILEHTSKFSGTGTDFEDFCTRFENELYQNQHAIKQFLLNLKSNALISFRALHIGGPGKPDIIRLPLYNYLRDYLTGFQALESKQYFRSRLRIEDVSKALYHAKRYNQDGVLIYTLAEDIPASIWDDVARVRKENGSYSYIIIDVDFMAFILSSLDLQDKLLP